MSLTPPPQPTILGTANVGVTVVKVISKQPTVVVAKKAIPARQSNDTPKTVVHLHS